MTRTPIKLLGRCQTHGLAAGLICILLSPSLQGQSDCEKAHGESGVFICYPNPNEHVEDKTVGTTFHLSAQANSLPGRKIARYAVFLDDRRVYEIKLTTPIERLTIEANVRSPLTSGHHTLRLVVDGAGSTDVSGLVFQPNGASGLCDPFSRFDPRNCLMWRTRRALNWNPESQGKTASPFASYGKYAELYGRNLKSIEADTADAVAVDSVGNLYAASHSSSDVELRKYAPDGSLLYGGLVRSCGPGALSVAAITVNDGGRVWVTGTTTACMTPSSNALQKDPGEPGQPHGFVMLIDTGQLASAAPVYFTYLFAAENRVSALRVDGDGNAYVSGTTGTSSQLANASMIRLDATGQLISGRRSGFVCALNASGSMLRWSTLLPGVQVNALAVDTAQTVYLTGRMRRGGGTSGQAFDEVVIAGLSDGGRRLSYVGRIGVSGNQEGRSISIGAGGSLLVTGETDSRTFFKKSGEVRLRSEPLRTFALALEPCTEGAVYGHFLDDGQIRMVPPVALQPALDRFARTFEGITERTTDENNFRHAYIVETKTSCASTVR